MFPAKINQIYHTHDWQLSVYYKYTARDKNFCFKNMFDVFFLCKNDKNLFKTIKCFAELSFYATSNYWHNLICHVILNSNHLQCIANTVFDGHFSILKKPLSPSRQWFFCNRKYFLVNIKKCCQWRSYGLVTPKAGVNSVTPPAPSVQFFNRNSMLL